MSERTDGSGDQRNEPSYDEIARRAFEISLESGASDEDNWLRAERELRGHSSPDPTSRSGRSGPAPGSPT